MPQNIFAGGKPKLLSKKELLLGWGFFLQLGNKGQNAVLFVEFCSLKNVSFSSDEAAASLLTLLYYLDHTVPLFCANL